MLALVSFQKCTSLRELIIDYQEGSVIEAGGWSLDERMGDGGSACFETSGCGGVANSYVW